MDCHGLFSHLLTLQRHGVARADCRLQTVLRTLRRAYSALPTADCKKSTSVWDMLAMRSVAATSQHACVTADIGASVMHPQSKLRLLGALRLRLERGLDRGVPASAGKDDQHADNVDGAGRVALKEEA